VGGGYGDIENLPGRRIPIRHGRRVTGKAGPFYSGLTLGCKAVRLPSAFCVYVNGAELNWAQILSSPKF